MEQSLEEVKKLWGQETDEWLVKAATRNLRDYKTETQEIIINEVKRRKLEGADVSSLKPSARRELKRNTRSFFATEIRFIQLGIMGGLIMMIGAVVWFFLGVLFGWIFFYPLILFLIGLYAFLKGLFTGNIAGKKIDEDNLVTEDIDEEDIIYNKKSKKF